jgi:hypothetical protein
MSPNARSVESGGQKLRGVLAALLTGASVMILVGFLGSGSIGWLAQALLVTAMPVLLVLLSSSASIARLLLVAMAGLWLLLGGSWAALIWLDGSGILTLGGIPLVLWILVFGLGLLPLGLVSWAYAATFEPHGPVPERPDRTVEIAATTDTVSP